MQPDGSNKSEERLQRHAKERRAQGGDFSLHPATRRLLQGEVTRQFGRRAQTGQTQSWFSLWRRHFAVGGALAAVLITASWFYFNNVAEKRSRMVLAELADAKSAVPERNVALESDHLAFDAEAGKAVAAGPMPTEPARPANKPAAVRSRALDGLVANEFQLGAKLETNNLALAVNARESKGAVHYFSDELTSALPVTNSVTTLSLAPVTDLWNYQSPLTPQTKAGTADAGVVLGWSVNGVAAGGAGATDSVLFAENSRQFYKLNTPMPQVALRNETDEAKRLSEATQLTKSQPQVAYENRAEPAALAPRGTIAPSVPAQFPADASGLGESLARSQSAGARLTAESRAGFGNRGDDVSRAAGVNNSQTFFRQALVPTEEPAANAQQLGDLLAKKSEDAAALQVLNEFTVEQRGNSVRLFDADGSVYNGVIDAPVATETEKLKEDVARDKDRAVVGRALQEQESRRAGQTNQTGEYSFRASGSNVATRQLVVVNARFWLGTNASNAVVNQRGFGAAGVAGDNAPAATPTGPPAARSSLQRFGRAGASTDSTVAIEGTVQVGPTNVQRFIAVPGRSQ